MRSFMRRMAFAIAISGFLGLLTVQSASAVQLLTNGNFETGTFAGWTALNQVGGDGSWFIDTPGTTSPVSGFPTLATGGNPHGNFYAVTDQGGSGSHVLIQSFNVATGTTSVILTWDMFNNNQDSGPFGTGLNFNVLPTQIARVDILTAAATVDDVGAGVLQNCFLGGTPGGNPHPFASSACDITAAVSGGGTFQLRFGETDNQFFFQMGIDNVAINAVAAQAPEPTSLLLLSLGIAGLAALGRTQGN
jgi:hypothetical protein